VVLQPCCSAVTGQGDKWKNRSSGLNKERTDKKSCGPRKQLIEEGADRILIQKISSTVGVSGASV